MKKTKSVIILTMLLAIVTAAIVIPQVRAVAIPPEDTDYVLIDDHWNMNWTGNGTLIWSSGELRYGYGPETGEDVWEMGPSLPPAVTSSDGNAYLVGTGPDKYVYYIVWSSGVWGDWIRLEGATNDSPAATVLGNKLHIVVRGTPNGLWHGYVDLLGGSFSGWMQLSGDTTSPPTLAASDTSIYLAVRGLDDHIYWRSWSSGLWGDWTSVPGATIDTPAATVLGNKLHLVVRGISGGLFHGSVNLLTEDWLGWTQVAGDSPSSPALAASGSKLFLVVRGYGDGIYYNVWDGVWNGWTLLSGVTIHRPAATVQNDKLHIAVRGVPRFTFHGYVNVTDQTFSGWTLMQCDLTLGDPSWGDFIDRLWVQRERESGDPFYAVWDLSKEYKEIVVFPHQDHGPYPAEALEYKIWGSNDFDISDPEGATWVEADLDRVYRKGWSDVGEGTYETCNDDYVAVWNFNCTADSGCHPPCISSYRYVKLQSIWEKPYDEPEIDAVKGVLKCGFKGRTVGFWKCNVLKALCQCEGTSQVSKEDILRCLEAITREYGSYCWLNFSQSSNYSKLWEAYQVLAFYHSCDCMKYKARGQILALLLTVCHYDCSTTPVNIPWYNNGETHSVNQWITIIFQEYDSNNFETAKDLADFLNNWNG